jgi:hypothetical protein
MQLKHISPFMAVSPLTAPAADRISILDRQTLWQKFDQLGSEIRQANKTLADQDCAEDECPWRAAISCDPEIRRQYIQLARAWREIARQGD